MRRNPKRYRFTLVIECERRDFATVEYRLTQSFMPEIEGDLGKQNVAMDIRIDNPKK